MAAAYPQRSLAVLLLFGTLAAAMALLASSLIFQLPPGRAGLGAAGPGALPPAAAAALLPVSAVLAALCLVLNVSCLLLCLLHGYLSAELCRGQPGSERADWFLLDSRSVRHAALGLFCCGVAIYLTALAMYMLLLFEPEAGIASACILCSGIVVLLAAVTHALLRAARASRRGGSAASHTLYENDSAHGAGSSANDPRSQSAAAPRPQIRREFSFPPGLECKSQLGSTAGGEPPSSGPRSERESSELPRTHRTLWAESGLLQVQGEPWNGVTQEMRNVLSSRKPAASGKDSTLV